MSSMTAEQVWALVKDWPEGAMPMANMMLWCGEYLSVDNGRGEPINTQLFCHAACGSGLAWLAEKHNAYMVHTTCFKVRMGGATHRGDNPLEAVSSAVLAASDERGGA